jgi:hypothetical protein
VRQAARLTTSESKSQRVDAQAPRGGHHEIAVRYEWHERRRREALKRLGPPPLRHLRLAELGRIIADRCGRFIPDTPDGLALLEVLVAHSVANEADREKRAEHARGVVRRYVPWMDGARVDALVRTMSRRRRGLPKADDVAKAINLSLADRQRLKIRTIGAVDMTKRQRKARRTAEAKARSERARRAAGVRPRAKSTARPWKELGISKAPASTASPFQRRSRPRSASRARPEVSRPSSLGPGRHHAPMPSLQSRARP